MAVQIQFRRDTAVNWTTVNPTLAIGEMALETDTKKFKIGDGATAWNALAYGGIVGATLTFGTGFTGTSYDGSTAKTIGIDSTVVTTTSNVQTLSNKTLASPVFTGQGAETVLVSTTGFAGYTFDVMNGALQYITAASTANGTINFRGNSTTTLNSFMAVNTTISCVLDVTNTGTAYYPNAFQIDGALVTPKFNGGTAISAGNTNSIDRYVFQITKTAANTYTVYATQVKFA